MIPSPVAPVLRDPLGINSLGVSTARKEPVGTMPPERSPLGGKHDEVPLPPTPTRRSHPAGTAPLMAMLVGAPPPPPDTPPPKKRRSASARHRRQKAAESALADEQPPTLVAADDGSLGMVSPTTHREKEEEGKTIPVTVEERLRQARKIYQSEELVMDPPTGEHLTGLHSKAPTPKMQQQENAVPAFGASPHKTVGDLLAAPVNVAVPPPASPMSSTTEQMGNHESASLPQVPLSPRQNDGNLASSGKGRNELVTKTTRSGPAKKRPKTPTRIRRALTPGRSRTPDTSTDQLTNRRRSSSVAAKAPKSPGRRRSTGGENATKKGGFFRKMFGGRKKTKGGTEESKALREIDSVTVAQSQSTMPKQNNSRQADENMLLISSRPLEGVTFSGSGDEQISGPRAAYDRPEMFLAQDEVSTLTAPTYESRRTSVDPTDSKDDSKGNAEPVGHYFQNAFGGTSSNDASAILRSSMMPSFDPFTTSFSEGPQQRNDVSGISGKLDITVDTAFDPVGESATDKKKSTAVNVQIPQPTIKDPSPRGQATMLYAVQDPSPRGPGRMPDPSPRLQPQKKPAPLMIQDPSPRGYQTPQFEEHQDPFGESPLHKNQRGPSALRDGSPYAPDPPLHLSSLDMSMESDGSSSGTEDHKEEGSFVGVGDKIVTVRQPPHPPPPPRRPSSPALPRPPSPAQRAPSPSARSKELLRRASARRRQLASEDDMLDENAASQRETIESAAAAQTFFQKQRKNPLPSAASCESNEMDSNTSLAGTEEKPSNLCEPIDSDLVLEEEASRAGMEIDISTRDDATELSELETTSVKAQSSKKLLSMSGYARMNAKAVAFLHTLNGEPSPRSAWRQGAESDDDEVSPKKTTPTKEAVTVEADSSKGENGLHMFAAYSDRFKGRTPKGTAAKATEFKKRIRNRATADHTSVPAASEVKAAPDLRIPADAFSLGVNLLREKREVGIMSGRLQRCIPNQIEVSKERSQMESVEDPEPMDPIQRAGRRLLSKAAVPIQASARRFLAQREAVDRMWALIEIQSYLRRWKAEASRLAYLQCATLIQRTFRGSRVRSALSTQHEAAKNIQRIVRGYIASIQTFDTVFMIILLQARARGVLVRSRLQREREEVRCQRMKASAERIQTWWRCRSARANFQFLVVDVIIAQSAIRRWHSEKRYKAIIAQKRNDAAMKIQAVWRGFQGYTDYIFSLVDLIVVQRTARKWLAKRKVSAMRKNRAAIVIQSSYRRFSAQKGMLFSLVHIIMAQSVARRYLARNMLDNKRQAVLEESIAATKIQAAWRSFWQFSQTVIMRYQACRIQAHMRGVLVRNEQHIRLGSCIMIQSIARRFLAIGYTRALRVAKTSVAARAEALRERHASTSIQFWWRVVLDCRKEKEAALVIERFFLMVKREVDREIARVARKSKAKRTRHRKKKESEEKMLERVWLNTVDEDHVNSNGFSPSASFMSAHSSKSFASHSPSSRVSSMSRTSSRSLRSKGERKSKTSPRMLSPSMKPVLRSQKSSTEREPSTDALNFSYSDDGSQVSASTASFAALYRTSLARKSSMSRSEMTDDLSLEEAYLDAAVEDRKERKRSAEKYMKIYGIRGSSSKSSANRSHHFFGEGIESIATGLSSGSSIQGIKYTSSQSASGTPTHSSLLVSPRSGLSPLGAMRSPLAASSPRMSPHAYDSKRSTRRTKEDEFAMI